MGQVVYGVWNGKVFDFRSGGAADTGALDLPSFDDFDVGNPVQVFLSDKGFLVFDPAADLLGVLRAHMEKARAQSCGRCTPCRMGTHVACDLLEALAAGQKTDEIWEKLSAIAQQMKETSLCGLGKACAVALLDVLTHFRDELEKKTEDGHGVFSYMTAPCIEACPSKVNVPRYISYLRNGQPMHSLGVVLQKYPMAATCGRVCVHFCEKACRRNLVDAAVSIKTLKRYVSDYQAATKTPLFAETMKVDVKYPDKRVAIVGGGPAGMCCAYHLLLRGYPVDIYEAMDSAGGMAQRGIPNYRLPKTIVKKETEIIATLGGRIFYNKALGRDFSLRSLKANGYKSIFVGVGCANGTRLGVTGEDPTLIGYEPGIDFLLKVHRHVDGTEPMKLSGDVVVVGGGNVAMDCARSAVRLGAAKVHVVYRRTKEDMPADKMEIDAAEKEGIVFHFLRNPTRIISNAGRLVGVEVAEMRQKEPDESGRRGVAAIEGSEHVLHCTSLIAAIGQQADKDAFQEEDGVQLDKYGLVVVNKVTQETTSVGVFAGGDVSLGPATLIHAMANGLTAANGMHDFMQTGHVRFSPTVRMRQLIKNNKFLTSDYIDVPVRSLVRVHNPELDPDVRRAMFEEVDLNITPEQAYKEAERCMRCYRLYSVGTAKPVPEESLAEIEAPAAS